MLYPERGIINLRGRIIPIYDLRIRFNLTASDDNPFTVVIILNLNNTDVGIVVDGVADVVALKDDEIEALPHGVNNFDTKFMTGIATIDSEMIVLMDVMELIEEGNHADLLETTIVL